MKAENLESKGCLQRDSVEREGYAGARSAESREGKEQGGADDLLESILDRDNLNKAYQRVKRNHGAPGIDRRTQRFSAFRSGLRLSLHAKNRCSLANF